MPAETWRAVSFHLKSSVYRAAVTLPLGLCSAHSRRKEGREAAVVPLTYLPPLKSKGKKFKQVAPDLHSGAGNSFQVPREPPAQI